MIQQYHLADAVLEVDTTDEPLHHRFALLYGECAGAGLPGLPLVRLRTRGDGGQVEVTFEGVEPVDLAAFLELAFPGREYAITPTADPGWQALRAASGFEAVVSTDGRRMRAPLDSEWRPLVGSLAIARAIAAQPGVLAFHAASVSVGGRGVMACGPKRAGKTTLALALGARGHPLLGDEIAAVRLDTAELLPMRRSLAVRDGPASAAAREALERLGPLMETFPDGEVRARAGVTALLGTGTPDRVPLTVVLLLRSFAPRAAAEAVAPSPEVLSRLTPLGASRWGRGPGQLVMTLLRMTARMRIFHVDAGSPDETADLVERLMETA